jgi:hypothetical protein
MKKRLTDSERTEVVNLSLDDISVADIAEHMGVSTNTVYGILRRNKVSPKRATFIDTVDTGKVIQDYNDFYPLSLVASRSKISVSQVYYILRNQNVPSRSKGESVVKQKGEMMDAAIDMYQEGYFIYEITGETGIHQPTLHEELHKRKIPLRRPRGRVTESQFTAMIRARMEEEEVSNDDSGQGTDETS